MHGMLSKYERILVMVYTNIAFNASQLCQVMEVKLISIISESECRTQTPSYCIELSRKRKKIADFNRQCMRRA